MFGKVSTRHDSKGSDASYALDWRGDASYANLPQDLVPAKAETCDVLQRGMLALAAMDLAYQCTNTKEPISSQATIYREKALHHQQAALPGFRVLLQSSDLSDRNAAFLFSIVLIILAFGTAHSALTKPTLEDILDFFALFRGPKTLWQLHGDVANAELVDTMSPRPTHQPFFNEEDEKLEELKGLVSDDVCAEAVSVLYSAWSKFDLNRQDVRSVAAVGPGSALVLYQHRLTTMPSFLLWLQKPFMTRSGSVTLTLFEF